VDDRAGALAEIVRLARQHQLTADDITSAIGLDREVPSASAVRGRGAIVRVLGVLGGIFVCAGIGVFIALQWDGMSAPARVIVTLGTGLAAFVLASLARREPRFARAASPLYLAAAALEPVGMLVAFDEFGSGGDWRWASLATTGTMAVQFGLAFAVADRSTLLFLSVAFATLCSWTVLDLAGVDGTLIALTVGAGVILAAVWADRSGHRDITPPWYFLGATAFLGGLFDVVESTLFETAFVAAAAGFVYLSVVLRSRTLLVVATLALLAYTGWFTAEHFADSIGWPLALVAFGLFMIGLSAVAVRIDRTYVRAR
jgi:hypothetical protein